MYQNLIIFNSESAYYYFRDQNFRQCVEECDGLLCDSVSLSFSLNIIGVKHRRLHGPDLFESYLADNPTNKVVILGGSKRAHRSIEEKFQLTDTLFMSAKIVPGNMDSQSQIIKEYRPAAVFICLGLRKQEGFIRHMLTLNGDMDGCEIIAGVGAAVDFASGSKVRAGRVFRMLGLEWLPRLLREPRMFPRIVRSIIGCVFVIVYAKEFKKKMDKFLVSIDV